MKYVDLTHLIEPNMPVFPGTEQPEFEYPVSIAKDGFLETKLHMYSHTGTHMDAPAHLIEGKPFLNEMDITQYCGKAAVIDATNVDIWIDLDMLLKYEETINKIDFILIKTGWDKLWGKANYFEDFPCLSKEACEWLVSKNIKGIGLDTISIDPVSSMDMVNHMIVLGSDMVIIENLKDLNLLGGEIVQFFTFPLNFVNSDGSPVRAVAAY